MAFRASVQLFYIYRSLRHDCFYIIFFFIYIFQFFYRASIYKFPYTPIKFLIKNP